MATQGGSNSNNDQLREAKNLLEQLNKLKRQLGEKKLELGDTQLIDRVKDLPNEIRRARKELEDMEGTASDLYSRLRGVTSEFKYQATTLGKVRGAFRQLEEAAQSLKYDEQAISDLNSNQLKKLQEKVVKNKELLGQEARSLYNQNSFAKNLDKEIEQFRAIGSSQEDINAYISQQLSSTNKLELEEKALLTLYYDQGNVLEDINRKVDKRLELEKKVEKIFGATGALIEGSSKLLSTMGFGHLSSELSELNDKLKSDLRDELQNSEGAANKLALGFKYMGKGLAGSAKIFANGLTDPLFIVGKIFDTYLEINKASVDVQRLTGQNAVTAASWNTSLAGAKDILETISELTKQTGRNAQNVFSEDVLVQAAELKTTMGLTGEEAGGIAMMAQTSNRSVKDITKSVVATTSAFNGANRSAVSQGQVLRDVANTADSIKLSLGNNDIAIAKAASAARRLGMDLERVDQIASSLLNFEDSISNELEAELLTGKQLNLEKARELALNNDLAGVGKELFKNSADIHEFGKMNRIQQESYAAALGMTKDELAKIAYQKALDLNMTEEQAEAATKVKAEDMKRLEIQKNFANALEKIAGALTPILDVVGNILSIPLAPYFILGTVAAAKLLKNVKSTVTSMGSLTKSTVDFYKKLKDGGAMNYLKGLVDKFGRLKKAFGEGFAGKVQEKVADAGGGITEKLADKAKDKAGDLVGDKGEGLVDTVTGKSADKAQELGEKVAQANDKTKNIKPGTGVKDFLTNLGKGLEAFGKSMRTGYGLLGIGLLVGSVVALGYALKIAAPGIEAFGKVITAAFSGLATLITAVADGFVKIIGAVTTDSIGPMLLLGPALFGIAAGLGAVALAGVLAIPAINAINTLSTASATITGTQATKEEPKERTIRGVAKSSEKQEARDKEVSLLERQIQLLVQLVNKDVNINFDSNKANRASTQQSYKIK